MTAPARGFTLVELMVYIVLLGIVSGALSSFVAAVYRSNKTSAGYVRDLDQCRRALRRVEGDLRNTQRVERIGSCARLHTSNGQVDYRLRGDVLERLAAGRRERVADRLAAFDVAQLGRLAEVRVELCRRAETPTRPAIVFSKICLQPEDGA